MIVYAEKNKKARLSRQRTTKEVVRGEGLINRIINSLPIELHIPGYQFCGPGTKLAERIKRGDIGINRLDAACKEHDIAYSQIRENIGARNIADQVLAEKAFSRVLARDAGIDEKAAALAIAGTMKVKAKLGMGLKKKKKNNKSVLSFNKIVQAAKKSMI